MLAIMHDNTEQEIMRNEDLATETLASVNIRMISHPGRLGTSLVGLFTKALDGD